MGDAEEARRGTYAAALPHVIPKFTYRRTADVPTQVWVLGRGDRSQYTGVEMLLNHLRIPYRMGDLGSNVSNAAAVFVTGAALADVIALRAALDNRTAVIAFMEKTPVHAVEGVQIWGLAERLLPHRDGLRSDFAAQVVRGLRDNLEMPLVTGKLPAQVGLRIDDVEGQAVGMWLATTRSHGWRPNLGLFLDSFSHGDNPSGPIIAEHCWRGECDASPHAFGPASFLLYDYPWGRPYSPEAFADRWRRAKVCFDHHRIPLSAVINAHFHVLSRSAAEVLAAEGARYFYSELAIDNARCVPDKDNWPSGDPTQCTSRMDPSGIMQLSSGDHILDVMNERSYYDFMMHGGAADPAEAARRIRRRLFLSLDCGFPAYVTTHEYLFQPWQDAEPHELLWSEVDAALAETGWGPVQKASLAEIADVAKAARANTILSVAPTGHDMLEVTLHGGGTDTLTIFGRGRFRSIPVAPGGAERTIRISMQT